MRGILLVLILTIAGGPAQAQDPVATLDSLWAMGGRVEVLERGERLLAEARSAADTATTSRLLLQRGVQLISLGRALEAEPLLLESMELATGRDDSLLVCRGRRWLSVVCGVLGRREEARRLYGELMDCARELQREDLQGWAQVGMGWDAAQLGEFPRSEEHYARAVEFFLASGEAQGEVWALNGLAIARRNQGDLDGARASYEKVIEEARARGATMVEGMGLNNLAHLELSVGDPAKAMEGFAASAALHRELAQYRESLVPRINLAHCLVELGDLGAARDTLLSCLDDARALPAPEQEAMAAESLGRVELAREQWDAAAASYREALQRGRAHSFAALRNCLLGLSTALARQDSSEAGLELLEPALAWCGPGSDALFCARLHLARGERLLEIGRTEDALSSLRLAARTAADAGMRTVELMALGSVAEAHRQRDEPVESLRVLRQAVALWEEEREFPSDPEWRAVRGALGRRIFTELAAAQREDPEAAFDQLQRYKGRMLLERMRGPAMGGVDPAWTARADARSLRQGQLDEGELFLDLYLGPRVSVAFALDRRGCSMWLLPDARELEDRVRRLHEAILSRGVEPELLREIVHALVEDLFAPGLESMRAARRIQLCADGALQLLPPALLEEVTGSAWSRIPSAGLLAQLRSQPTARGPEPGVALMGEGSEVSPPELPALAAETRWLRQHFQGVVAAGDSLRGRQVLHLAAHALADDARPWRSRFVLPGGRERTALDLLEEGSDARLAVLTSCSTARGRTLSGEGVQSLSTALLGSGVPAAVASLWPVDDAATYALVRGLYRGLEAGSGVQEALREAQRSLRDAPETAHPYYWAGFVVEGEPTQAVDLRARIAPGPRSLGLALLLVGGLILLLARRR